MKVSILSFTKETNFGANLQCYALCKTLQNMGHEVNIIDIQLRKGKMSWYSAIMYMPMIYLFYKFRQQYLNLFTRQSKSIDDLILNCPQSDLFIVGSDQVWNPDITKRLNPLVYFFSFLPADARRISYAASFGTDRWQHPELTDNVRTLLHLFDAVSVREQTGQEICRNIFDIEANLVIDPTLLLSSYDDICGSYNPLCETNEITYFTFVHNKEVQKIIADFAEEHSLKAVILRSNRSYPRFKRKLYVSVAGWLNSIRYSQLVVTTSFHCMVFCILFHKRFVVVPGKTERLTRQKSLLEQLGLLDYFCEDTSNLKNALVNAFYKPIDYSNIEMKINTLRKRSLSYLKNIINY